jgi:ABC-type dipeptide/oligopeptide/nickel transport system permease subunit
MTADVQELSAGEAPLRQAPSRLAVRRFFRHKLALVGLAVFALIVLATLAAPLLAGHSPTDVNLLATRQPPSGEHLLGTDASGRDVLARLLYAGRVSLGVSLAAAAISVLTGALLGSIAGILGGWVDMVVMRVADIVLSFPALVVVVVIAGVFGPSVLTMTLAIGLIGWPTASRVVRGVTLSLREREYVQAARAVGAKSRWLIVHHVLPAVLGPLVVVATLDVAQFILLEAALSFLGLGVQPPAPSWGNMLNQAQSLTVISSMPWLWVPPGLAVAVTVLSVNFVGDGLQDAVDPRQA